MSASNTEEVYAELLARTGEAQPRPRLAPVLRLTDLLGQPQNLYPVIHVGGTNGKTTTSRVIESLLRAYGLRTGLFTSPHLVDFTERIQIDGEQISEPALVEAWQEMQPALDVVDAELVAEGELPITFFEALAALAYTAFADAPVEVAIVEIGMGGEWDATNITDAEVSVMTPIGLDHVHVLGNTVAEIARTKAFIVKPGKVLVSAAQDPQALASLRARVDEIGATMLVAGDDFSLRADVSGVGGRIVEITGISGTDYEGLFIPLYGPHQAENVTVAVAAVEAFLGTERPLPEDALEQGLGSLTSPGRLQPIGVQPLVLVDSAHNPHGARTLAAAIEESFHFSELMLVIGTFADKDAQGILEALLPLTPDVYVVGIHSDRSRDPEELAQLARGIREDINLQLFDELEEALEEARGWADEAEGRGVLVAGSVFLAGEAITIARAADWGADI